jgi:hypothetical protein
LFSSYPKPLLVSWETLAFLKNIYAIQITRILAYVIMLYSIRKINSDL